MDLKALIARMDKIESRQILNEAITMKDIQAAVGQEKDEQKRAAILNDLAWKENLPGLYDPISGYFIRKQSPNPETNQVSIAATAREADTQALAKLGLVPGTAKTSALGGLVGTGKFGLDKDSQAANNKASSDVKQQSANVQGKQSSDAFIAPKLKRLTDLVAKISGGTMESISFNGELARTLVESFSYQLYEKVTLGTGEPVRNPATGVTAGKYQSEVAEIKSLMAELADIDDPAVIQALGSAQKALDKLSGSANEPNIMKPRPTDGDKKPTGPSGTQVQTDDDGNHMITTPDGKTVVVGPDGKPLPNGGKETPGKTADKPADKPAGPTGTGKVGPANPGTKAIQHYLNTKHGQKLDVDGRDGPLTTAAIRSLSGKLSTDEYANIAGLAYAYNVKPGQGPGTVSLGNPEFVKRMTALGYDPKTGDPVGGSAKGGGQAASPAAGGITPGQNARDDLLARQGAKGGQAASPAGGDVQAELNKIMPDAQGGEEAWYKGTRYQYLRTKGLANPGEWKPNMKAGDGGMNWNQWASTSGFTGPQSDVKAAYNNAPLRASSKTPTAATQSASPSASGSKSSTSSSELRIAGAPVVPGQPLSQVQMSVMASGMKMGNTYPPEVMAQYNKQKGASPTKESIAQSEDDAILAMIRAVR